MRASPGRKASHEPVVFVLPATCGLETAATYYGLPATRSSWLCLRKHKLLRPHTEEGARCQVKADTAHSVTWTILDFWTPLVSANPTINVFSRRSLTRHQAPGKTLGENIQSRCFLGSGEVSSPEYAHAICLPPVAVQIRSNLLVCGNRSVQIEDLPILRVRL